MLELLQYSFIQRALLAGVVIAIIAPLIGIFLVLRRYSLIADTLSHVSLAGVALGLVLKINPLFSALGVSVVASLLIEKLRLGKKISGESALALFLSGSLALALVLISLANGFNADLFTYLFGSIVSVKPTDLYLIAGLGLATILIVWAFYRQFLYTSFDEDAAKVSGIKVRQVNLLLIGLTATTVSLAIPIVGVLLISALIVIPVISALQFRRSFIETLMVAETISISSVVLGIIASYYLDISTGGTIVLLSIAMFAASLAAGRITKSSKR